MTSILSFITKLFKYIKYNLKSKWGFIYLERVLDDKMFSMKINEELFSIRIAKQRDIPKIKKDIYPLLPEDDKENDGRDIEQIGTSDNLFCFIAEKEGKIIHYFLVYPSAVDSPLIKTPFSKMKIGDEASYLGSAFTIPEARGLWVVPASLSFIMQYLKNNIQAKKTYVLVHKDTLGAVEFYEKLGFCKVENAVSKGLLFKLSQLFSK